MNAKAYRQHVLQELAAEQAAGKKYLGEARPEDLPELKKVALDGQADVQSRSASLAKLVCAGEKDADIVDAVIKILGDAKEPSALRLAALQALKQLLFISPMVRTRRSHYLAALRTAI